MFTKEEFEKEVLRSKELCFPATFDQGFLEGFKLALESYAIWREGVRRIGCQETPIKDILGALKK